MQKILQALRSMGYRKMRPDQDTWGKPVATNLYAIRIDTGRLEFVNYFKGATGVVERWASSIVPRVDVERRFGNVLGWVKYVECWSGDLRPHLPSEFEFTTVEDQIDL